MINNTDCVLSGKVEGIGNKVEKLCKGYLVEVGHKWFEIGVLLGIPISMLMQEIEDLEAHLRIQEVVQVRCSSFSVLAINNHYFFN